MSKISFTEVSAGNVELNREYPELDDPEVFENMVKVTLERMGERKCPHVRGQHAKATGCVTAEFQIANDIPPDLRHGVFRIPGHTFSAKVRFSNSDGTIEADGCKAARGLAIKLQDVVGLRALPGDGDGSQDFLMVNHPVFPFPNPKKYLETMKRMAFGEKLPIGEFMSHVAGKIFAGVHMKFFEPKELSIAEEIKGKHVASPLEISYWSGAPYWLGPASGEGGHAVKYSAVSRQKARTPIPEDPEKEPGDYLTQALMRGLRSQEAVFDFKVQLQTNADTMPVEDVSMEWDETVSPPITVATLRIPPQEVKASGDLATQCEAMSFNPWHALAEHRPMGGMNRLRKMVYAASVNERGSH